MASSDVMASDLKRSAEEVAQVAEKKQKVDQPSDELEDDSWADEVEVAPPGPTAGGTSTEKPKADAAEVSDKAIASATESKGEAASGSGSSGTPAGAAAETKEAAASGSKEPTSDTAPTATAGDDSKAVAKVVAEVDPNSLTVCVKSISYSVEEDQFELDFGDHGEIEDFVWFENRGLAFITYASKEGVEAALKMDGDEYWGRKLGVALADKASMPPTEVFEVLVRGLPVAAEEEAVRKHFLPCGEIIKCKMRPGKEDRDGVAKSSAFLVFKTQEALDSAVKLKGSKFQDDIISVLVADNDQDKGGKGKGKGGKGGKGKGKDKGKSKGKGKNSKGKGGKR